jgi:hypothetical protein
VAGNGLCRRPASALATGSPANPLKLDVPRLGMSMPFRNATRWSVHVPVVPVSSAARTAGDRLLKFNDGGTAGKYRASALNGHSKCQADART